MHATAAVRWLGAIACTFAAQVSAQSSPNADWACWYGGGGKLNCLLLKASDNTKLPVQPGQGNGEPVPEDAILIWQGGTELYDAIVEIPLMNDPEDMALVEQLAHFSVCGSAVDCSMTFVSSATELALLQESYSNLR
ncbi:MAG: hypothetical protein KDG52_01230 [Rhodocyclaceae bacterium]|nr:hypothetical protein [Rhodocyclaceae bacterium]